MKFLYWLLAIAIFIGIIVWNDKADLRKKYESDMEIMYSTINGKITNSGEKEEFHDYIQVNDTLYRLNHSDSIYVIRNGQKKGFRVYLDIGK